MLARKEDFPTVSDRCSTGLNEAWEGGRFLMAPPTLKGGGFRGMGVRPLSRPTPTNPPDRVCQEEGCDTRLSIYNAWKRCWQHEPRRRLRSWASRATR